MKLVPYIFFYGRCEEALEFYKTALGGTYELMRNSDAPPEVREHMPPGGEQRVMHATFTAGDLTFMCSDGREDKAIDPDAGNMSLALTTGEADGDRVFAALSDGGKVTMPMAPAFWGARFGMLVDRFGNEWMLSTQ